MTELTLESIGLTQDELQDRVVQRICGQIMESTYYDEDGGFPSDLAKKIRSDVQERIDAAVAKVGEEQVRPMVEDMVDDCTLQLTNQWGESRGDPVSFKEYLVARADKWMRADVNHDGKSKDEIHGDTYGWRAHTTRISNMIDSHLKYRIEVAMKEVLKGANDTFAKGISEAVQMSLQKLMDKVSVTAEIKR